MTSGVKNWLVEAGRALQRREQIYLAVLAIGLGFASAYGAIAFWHTAEEIHTLVFGSSTADLPSLARSMPWWLLLLVPTCGGLIIGLFVTKFLPDSRNQTVADVIESAALLGGRMQFTTGIFAAGAAATSIGCGASVGREGPVVHLGATLASLLGQALKLDRSTTRTLLGCGVAAAFASSFNAPIAGVFFALEVVFGHYRMTAFTPVVISSVVGTAFSRSHLGDQPAFAVPPLEIVSYLEIPAFALLGFVSAAVAILFMAAVMYTGDFFAKLPLRRSLHAMIGGFLIGVLALVYPQVLGVGYEASDQALNGTMPLWLMVALMVTKTMATSISLGSGFGGGVFSPSLVVGAMCGGTFGFFAGSILPDYATAHNAYAIVGMGAVAGAVLGAPISTILIVFELTTSYSLTIALMVATAISSLVTRQVLGGSFFIWQLKRRGIDLDHELDTRILRSSPVSDIITTDYRLVRHDAPLAEARDALARSASGAVFVVDENDRFYGSLAYADVREVIRDPDTAEHTTAGEIARQDSGILMADDNLKDALEIMETLCASHLPVIDDEASMRVVGTVHQSMAVRAQERLLTSARSGDR